MDENNFVAEQVNDNQQDAEVKVEQKQEKVYSKEEVTDIVEKRLNRERAKLEKQWQEKFNALEESMKLSKMSEDEKQQFEYDKRIKELEAREKALQEKESAYNKQQYLNEITTQLQAKGLPTDMAELLVDFDAETVASKIASMEKSFNTQVNNSIQDKIKSSANTPTVPQEETKPLTLDDINAMSPTQFKQNKAEIEKVLMEAFKK